jgi:hypothetical protein
MGVPTEVRFYIYRYTLQGEEAPRGLTLLETCRQAYHEAHETALQSVVYPIHEATWRQPIVKARDDRMNNTFNLEDRALISHVKFVLTNNNVNTFFLEPVTRTLALHGIRPRTVILFYSLAIPLFGSAIVDILTTMVRMIAVQQPTVLNVIICNMPKTDILPLAYRILDRFFIVGQDIEADADDLENRFNGNGVDVEFAVQAAQGSRDLRSVNMHITTTPYSRTISHGRSQASSGLYNMKHLPKG